MTLVGFKMLIFQGVHLPSILPRVLSHLCHDGSKALSCSRRCFFGNGNNEVAGHQKDKQTNKQKPREVVNKKNTGFLCFFLGDEVLLGGGFKHLFSPLLGEMIPFLTYISQMGWNRQLDKNTWDIYLCVPGNGWIFLNAKINSVAVFWKVRIDVE